MDDRSRAFEGALLSMDRVTASALIDEARRTESPLGTIDSVVTPALDRIGRDWEAGHVALAQVYMAGRICEDLIESLLSVRAEGRQSTVRLAVATLQDHHLLGKRLVLSVLHAAGYAPLDYGAVAVDELVAKTVADRLDVLLISVLMLPSALLVKQVREGLDRAGAKVHLIVGGAPFRLDRELWREVGADAAGARASDAPELVAAAGEGRP